MLLQNKVALVTGGSRGIGRAICLDMAREGAIVAINYNRSEEAAVALHEEIHAMGMSSKLYKADVTNIKEAEHMISSIEKDHGKLDILVNNAGTAYISFLMLTPVDKWQSMMDTNLNSVFYCTRRAIKSMIHSRSGRIINISSIGAIKGSTGNATYSATKAALIGFTKSLAQEVGKFNILVNCVLPGLIDTDMLHQLDEEFIKQSTAQIPLQRIGKPEEVASVVSFRASDKASYVTGQNFVVDGGIT